MRERSKLQASVIARSWIAQHLRRSSHDGAMYADDQQYGEGAQNDLLQREIGQSDTARCAGSAREPLSVILRSPRIMRRSTPLALPCAGLEGWRPQTLQLAPIQYHCGRRPSRLARPEEAALAPQGDGYTDVLAAVILTLQAHALLGVLIGREFLVARRVAVVAQDEGHQIRVDLWAQLPRSVWRHRQADIAIQHRNIAVPPAGAEIAALERRPAELAVVERGTVAILAALPIGRLSALGLRRREGRRRRPLLPVDRDSTAGSDRGAERQSGKLKQQAHFHKAPGSRYRFREELNLAVNSANVHAVRPSIGGLISIWQPSCQRTFRHYVFPGTGLVLRAGADT
jgi:hypothetical protein